MEHDKHNPGKGMRRLATRGALGNLQALIAVVCLASGCAVIPVSSDPPGARILLDGTDTGQVTPDVLRIRDIRVGRHTVSVQKDGYRLVTPPLPIRVRVDSGQIAISVVFFPIFLPWNLVDNLWKTTDPTTWEGLKFNLEKGIDTSRTAEATQSKTSGTAVPGSGGDVNPVPAAGRADIADRLRQLERLKKEGLITEQEYSQKRQSLLDQL